MANKGTVPCSDVISDQFGEKDEGFRDLVLQNEGTSNIYVHWDTAEASKGLRIAPGESVCTKYLPDSWRGSLVDGLTAICKSGETSTLIWSA